MGMGLKDLIKKKKETLAAEGAKPNGTVVSDSGNINILGMVAGSRSDNNNVDSVGSESIDRNVKPQATQATQGIKLNLKLKPVAQTTQIVVEPTVILTEPVPPAQAFTEEEFNHPSMIAKFAPKDVEGFKETVKVLYNSFEYPEMVGNATKNILISCRENPEFVKLLLPEDYGLMIRALRTNHGLVVSSKIAGKAKKSAKAAEIDRMVDMLGDIELDVG
jgi:hypothetical protein